MRDHKKFLLKSAVFILLNMFIWGWLLASKMENLSPLHNKDTETHLFTIPKNEAYGFVLMGNSHAEAFAGGDSHTLVESILGMKFFSFAKRGAGVLPEKIYLSYFFKQQNTTKYIIYFIDPFVMYSPKFNEKYPFDTEPYHNSVLLNMIKNGFEWHILSDYLTSNFDPRNHPSPQPSYACGTNALESLDQNKMQMAMADLYSDGLDRSSFNKYAVELGDQISLSNQHGARTIFIIPPYVWRHDPGRNELLGILRQYEQRYGIKYYDFSNSISDPGMYIDATNHLSCKGVQYFTERFLKPIFVEKI
jgi:hypothetical protein